MVQVFKTELINTDNECSTGRLEKVIIPDGREIKYYYNRGLVTRIVHTNGSEEFYRWLEAG